MVTGPRHQATVAQPVQQFIQAREGIEHPELPVDPLPQILGPSHAGLGIGGLLVEVVPDLLFRGVAQPPLVASAAPLGQSVQALGVVAIDPGLHDPPGNPQDVGDLWGGLALLGQQHHLQSLQSLRFGLLADQTLQVLDTVMVDHMHGSPPCENQHATANPRAQP